MERDGTRKVGVPVLGRAEGRRQVGVWGPCWDIEFFKQIAVYEVKGGIEGPLERPVVVGVTILSTKRGERERERGGERGRE